MIRGVVRAAAVITLAIHLIWILFVVFGALWTRGRSLLTAVHLASLLWGIIVELTPLPCPLTLAEQLFEARGGIDPYRGDFLINYLDRLVYPDIRETLLVYFGVAVCAANLLIYARRFWAARQLHRTERS